MATLIENACEIYDPNKKSFAHNNRIIIMAPNDKEYRENWDYINSNYSNAKLYTFEDSLGFLVDFGTPKGLYLLSKGINGKIYKIT